MVTKQVIFACRDDPCPVKLNLSAGAYRTEVTLVPFLSKFYGSSQSLG